MALERRLSTSVTSSGRGPAPVAQDREGRFRVHEAAAPAPGGAAGLRWRSSEIGDTVTVAGSRQQTAGGRRRPEPGETRR
jgi:hypothetical protein